jgi:DNA polymerase-3 subunit delta'
MLTLDQMKNRLVFLTGEEADFSLKFHPFINHENIYSFSDEFNKAFSNIEGNGNAKIIFLDLGLRVTKLITR